MLPWSVLFSGPRSRSVYLNTTRQTLHPGYGPPCCINDAHAAPLERHSSSIKCLAVVSFLGRSSRCRRGRSGLWQPLTWDSLRYKAVFGTKPTPLLDSNLEFIASQLRLWSLRDAMRHLIQAQRLWYLNRIVPYFGNAAFLDSIVRPYRKALRMIYNDMPVRS